MRKHIFSGSLFMLILLSPCKNSSLLVNGVKRPKAETPEQLKYFLVSTNSPEQNFTVVKFEELASVIINGITPTSVYVFDKKGNNLKLPGSVNNKCAPEPSLFIQRLTPSKEYNTDSTFDLKSINSWICTTDNKDFIVNNNVDPDFYVFITWAVWPGKKIFQRDIMSCISSAKNNKESKIELVLVNLDMQTIWGEDNLKKVEFTRTSMNVRY